VNVERLYSVLSGVQEDVENTKAQSLLQQLQDALSQLATQPQQDARQREVSSLRAELASSLATAASNDYSPVWRHTLDELGLSPLLGQELSSRIEGVFAQNELTPAAAADQLGEILGEFTPAMAAVSGALQAFSTLAIGSEALPPGGIEVSLLVPRGAVSNEFNELSAEMGRLDKILGVFVELGTGSRPPLKVRSIASSDFSFFLDVAPRAGAYIAIAVERVVALYKSLLEIRRLRAELADQGLDDQSLGGIDNHANTHMSTGIERTADDIIEELGTAVDNPERLNELKIELRLAMNAIANRVDAGYHIDVRIGALPETTDEDETENGDGDASSESDSMNRIASAQEGLKFMRLTGTPILQLVETDEGDEDDQPVPGAADPPD